MTLPLLKLQNITRRFGNATAVNNITLEVNSGEFFTLLGPSGCGKTTLLRMIAGFDQPDEGQILLDGKNIIGLPPEKRPFHTVFQSYALFPHLTVAENVAFPLKMAKKEHAFIQQRVKETLELVHLEDKGHRFPNELSGGQCQRVALARSLINQPRLLLLDEPTSALDAKLREKLLVELSSLQRTTGITFIFITHAQDEALALSHRIAVMNSGHVEQLDEPSKIYSYPKNRFVANFIGNCNLLAGTVESFNTSHLQMNIPQLGEVQAPLHEKNYKGKGWLALRPEHIAIAAPDADLNYTNMFHGKVCDFLYVGDVTTYIVELDSGQRIEALLANSGLGSLRFFDIGDHVQVAWHADAGYFLPDSADQLASASFPVESALTASSQT